MAWQYRATTVTQVPARREIGQDASGNPILEDYVIDLIAEGRVGFHVEYFDEAAPRRILYEHNFELQIGAGTQPEELAQRFKAAGAAARDRPRLEQEQQVRDVQARAAARARAEAIRSFAISTLEGRVFPVD